jgi:hypothetical protein
MSIDRDTPLHGFAMSERVDEIRQRLEAATPGPWKADATENDVPVVCVDGPIPGTATVLFEGDWAEQPDAELIAHAPTDLAFLLDEVTQLTDQLAAAGDFMDPITRKLWIDGLRKTTDD